MPRYVHGVLADEELYVTIEALHGVARADADDAFVGVDAHDRRVESRARHRIPGGMKWRVERQRIR